MACRDTDAILLGGLIHIPLIIAIIILWCELFKAKTLLITFLLKSIYIKKTVVALFFL